MPLKFSAVGYVDGKGVALRGPEGIACTDDGKAIVADTGNGRLLKFTFRDGELTPETEIKVPQLGYPVRVQLDSKGNPLVLDRRSAKIARLDAKGAFAGYVDVKDGSADVRPVAFKVDAADGIYVLDGAGRSVLVADAAGKVSRRLKLPDGRGVFTDVAVDANGTVYTVDEVAAQVWSAGKGDAEFKPFTKSLKEFMSFPGYLATTSRGVMVIVDQNGGGLVMIGSDGSYQGRQLSLGVAIGLLNYPAQVCFTKAGDAFVADRSNNRVQVFVPFE
jgi:DNA-binding beta-propeller fold protein YncE